MGAGRAAGHLPRDVNVPVRSADRQDLAAATVDLDPHLALAPVGALDAVGAAAARDDMHLPHALALGDADRIALGHVAAGFLAPIAAIMVAPVVIAHLFRGTMRIPSRPI